MAGRGLRPAAGKDKLILIDHSGAVYRHGLLEDQIEWTLDVDERAENKAHEKRSLDKTSRIVECSQCGALRKGGEPCPSCGFMPKAVSDAIIFSDGDLEEIGATHQPVNQQEFYAELLYIQVDRGYKRGWAAHQFKKKFKRFPPWAWNNLEPVEPSQATSSWVRSRQIAYARSRAAA
jgi:superfamily II DNA or RNA helicase